VSFAAITLCVASQRVFIVTVVYFVIDSVRKLLDTLSYFKNIQAFCGWGHEVQNVEAVVTCPHNSSPELEYGF
jgi:uncharacterized membrane protein